MAYSRKSVSVRGPVSGRQDACVTRWKQPASNPLAVGPDKLHGRYRHRNVAVRSDENDWNLNIGFDELASISGKSEFEQRPSRTRRDS
jgi:hypothetical protein